MEKDIIMSYIDELLSEYSNEEAESILDSVIDEIENRINQCQQGTYSDIN